MARYVRNSGGWQYQDDRPEAFVRMSHGRMHRSTPTYLGVSKTLSDYDGGNQQASARPTLHKLGGFILDISELPN
jgi:hypothetical protein